MRHLMSPLDFSVDELDKLLDLANDIEKYPNKYAHACEGKKLATFFWMTHCADICVTADHTDCIRNAFTL